MTEKTDFRAYSHYEETVSHRRHRTVWVVLCLFLTFLCLAARQGQAGGFAPWDDFFLNLFHQ